MTSSPLVAAWMMLIAIGFATTLSTLIEPSGPMGRIVVAIVVLALAALKARVILGRYLGLAASRFWTRGFDFAVGGFLTVALVLYTLGTSP